MDINSILQWVVGLVGLSLLPWWLIKLWESLKHLANYQPPPPPPKLEVRKIARPKKFWMRGPILFAIGSAFTFLGFALTIFFRDGQFLILIVVGSLFLSGLFFYSYFIIFSREERALFSKHKSIRQEKLMLFTHPAWVFHYPRFAILGGGVILGGVISGTVYGDVYLMLLAIYGLVFMLHLWSFTQLNILTVTDRRISLRTGLPADSIIDMPLSQIATIHVTQSLIQRLFRIHTLRLTDDQGADLNIHVPFPHLITDLIPSYQEETP